MRKEIVAMTLGFTMTFSSMAVAQTTNVMGVIGATRAQIGKMWDKSVMGIIEAPQFLKLPICEDTDTAVLEELRRVNPAYFPKTASEERERKEKEVLEEFHQRQRQYQAKHVNADTQQEQDPVSPPPPTFWQRNKKIIAVVAIGVVAVGAVALVARIAWARGRGAGGDRAAAARQPEDVEEQPQQQPAGGPQQQPAGGPQQQPAGGPQQQPAGGPQQQPAGGPQQQLDDPVPPPARPPAPAAAAIPPEPDPARVALPSIDIIQERLDHGGWHKCYFVPPMADIFASHEVSAALLAENPDRVGELLHEALKPEYKSQTSPKTMSTIISNPTWVAVPEVLDQDRQRQDRRARSPIDQHIDLMTSYFGFNGDRYNPRLCEILNTPDARAAIEESNFDALGDILYENRRERPSDDKRGLRGKFRDAAHKVFDERRRIESGRHAWDED